VADRLLGVGGRERLVLVGRERPVEVRARRALRASVGEDVAGAAGRDEELLARGGVAVAGGDAADRAAAGRGERGGREGEREQGAATATQGCGAPCLRPQRPPPSSRGSGRRGRAR